MPGMTAGNEVADRGLVVRYAVNGLAATAVHYGVLTFNIGVLQVPSAGVANFLAAAVGIATSFLGNRYFVFRARDGGLVSQSARFGLLYAAAALLHGALLFVWTDLGGLDYRIGFLVATALQVAMSYWGNKRYVFVK